MITLNGEEVVFEQFPNGETRLNLTIKEKLENLIKFKFEDDSDLIKLMFLRKELKSKLNKLEIMYFPYSRQDRATKSACFTLESIAEFINNLSFSKVGIFEPHSDVCLKLTNNSYPIWFTMFMFQAFIKEGDFDVKKDYVMFPDKGACDRYLSKMPNVNYVIGEKQRDQYSGKIKKFNLVGELPKGAKVFILDDLSSYGGTFVFASRALKEAGASEISLVVAHAEKSILMGKIPVDGIIKKVYTSNSIIDKSQESELISITEII